VIYTGSGATVQLSFDSYTTEDGVEAGIDRIPFAPAANPELLWGLRTLHSDVFRGSDPSRTDARSVCNALHTISLKFVDQNAIVTRRMVCKETP